MGSVGVLKLLPSSESLSELTSCILEETEPSHVALWAELVPTDRTSVQGPVTASVQGYDYSSHTRHMVTCRPSQLNASFWKQGHKD